MIHSIIRPLTLLVFATGLFSENSIAQQFYADINMGYGIPVSGSSTFLRDATNYSDQSTNYYSNTVKVKPLSLGNGMNFGINTGYLFNKYIGFDLGINYQIGNATTGTQNSTYYDSIPVPSFGKSSFKQSFRSNMLYITPSLLLQTDLKKFSPYAKLGFAMGYGKIYHDVEEYHNVYGSSKYTEEFYGGLALGFELGMGATYNLNERFGIYAEAYYRNMTYSPKKSTITAHSRNGNDDLDQYSAAYIETEYEKEVTEDKDRSQPDYSSPSKETLISFPYHSLGLKLGLKLNF